MMKENKNKGTFLNYLLGIFVLLISVQLSAKTIYVSNSGKDSNDGTFSKPTSF